MKQSRAILMLGLTGLASLAFAPVGIAEEQPSPAVKVGVYARHSGGKIVYHYRVVNNSPHNIAAVSIGRDNQNDENPDNDVWELHELPAGWHSKLGIPSASANSPTGWRVSVITLVESGTHAIAWETINDKSPNLLAGQTLTRMSVALDKADTNYLTGHALIHFADRYPPSLTVPLERLDTTPPSLTVNLSPNTLRSPDSKLMPVNAIFTIKDDDYDRLPEIKLESITANEPLEPGDIRDASFGIDDRYIKLRAHHNGASDRIYTVIYSATDASGNQTLASATVTVPHNQVK